MKVVLIGVALACAAAAQIPAGGPPPQSGAELARREYPKDEPIYQNTGAPMRTPFQCTEDDLQWAGMSCSETEPCPVFLELSAVQPVADNIFAVGNIHSASITLYSIVLASGDGGRTWREPYERMRGAGLDHIQFIDFQNGWIGGQLLQPLPRDPFLLITSDGGKTWRLRPLSSESKSGSIQQFWFESKTLGSLLLDRGQSRDGMRYELYESPNGGETWMIRELSEHPIRLKRAPTATANPLWRIRADSKSQAFHIEKRQGERWSSIASFLVPVAQCKPPETRDVLPPAERPPNKKASAKKTPGDPHDQAHVCRHGQCHPLRGDGRREIARKW